MPKIAFICTGNICRSPMAEYLLKALAPASWNLQTCSFGILTTDGHEASTNATIVAMEEGIDLSPHRSRAVRPDELRACDLILTMTTGHKEHLLCMMADLKDRTFCLTEFEKKPGKIKDIDDPIRGDLSVYRTCFGQIRKEIDRILPYLGPYFGLE